MRLDLFDEVTVKELVVGPSSDLTSNCLLLTAIFFLVGTVLTENMVDISVLDTIRMVPGTLNSSQEVLSRLVEELRRIINFPACEICIVYGAHMNYTRSQWLPKDMPPVLPDRVLEILDTPTAESTNLRLLETKGSRIGYYITLSHRWGGGFTLKTTSRTHSQRLQALKYNFHWSDVNCTGFRNGLMISVPPNTTL